MGLQRFLLATAAAFCLALPAFAQKSTVCTVTVNSADERDAFRRSLPEDRFEFVELVERGRPDWLASACRRQVRCDVLVVSGHFAGTEFYSSRFDAAESLPVEEIERAQCSASCPALFSQLKEVYLFGCDTLKPDPVKSAAPEIVRNLVRNGADRAQAERLARALSERYGESSRDLMRRLFPGVPAIYGFASLAPYGRVAGPMLDRYFEAAAPDEVGSGRVSERLLKLFGPASMTVASGMDDSEPNADYRRESCRFLDDRVAMERKVDAIHEILGGEMTAVRMSFDRVEGFFAAPGARDASAAPALARLAADRGARSTYLAIVRETEDPALRVRMIALAREIGWLAPEERRAELALLVLDMLRGEAMGYGEVDLVCTLNKDRLLDDELATFKVSTLPGRTAQAAALACLGSEAARASVLRAVASPDEREVQIAQAYLRHHPMTKASELRAVALGVARMQGSGAQVRALDTLARHHISDRKVLEELARLFTRATSLGVQRAIAEIFLRSDAHAIAAHGLAAKLRRYRLRSPDGEDLIDTLIQRLEPA
jgi:hypothetical protein